MSKVHLAFLLASSVVLACPMLYADVADIDIDSDTDTDSDTDSDTDGDTDKVDVDAGSTDGDADTDTGKEGDDDQDDEDDGSCAVVHKNSSDFPAKLGLVVALIAFGLLVRRRSRS